MPDAIVDPAREAGGRASYESLRLQIPTIKPRTMAIVAQPNSLLELDDQQTSFEPIAHQVRWQLQVTYENLTALDQLIQAHGLPTYAGYPLIRAAVEAAAQALWLIQHNHSAKRAIRALRSSYWQSSEAANLSDSLGYPDPDRDERVRGALEQLRRKIKALHQQPLDVDRISRTDMLREVERHLKLPQPTPLVTWRLCSSLAHANSYTASFSMQRTQRSPDEPQLWVATSSWAMVASMVRTTLAVTDAAIARLDELATTTRR